MTKEYTPVMDLAQANIIKRQAIALLKEIKLVCGINIRKYEDKTKSYSNTGNVIAGEFRFINSQIDKFTEENKMEKFKS
jgi:hypothetical protein|tara:strand:+ start:322 stop:558 length:237 start_codon:yes stop_codon:yes gene_type:complete